MKAAIQFIIRQSGWLAFYFLVFAVGCGTDVCIGLWQGSGLHGYVIHQGKTRNGYVVPVWRSFMQAVVFLSCAALFGLIAVRRNRGTIS